VASCIRPAPRPGAGAASEFLSGNSRPDRTDYWLEFPTTKDCLVLLKTDPGRWRIRVTATSTVSTVHDLAGGWAVFSNLTVEATQELDRVMAGRLAAERHIPPGRNPSRAGRSAIMARRPLRPVERVAPAART